MIQQIFETYFACNALAMHRTTDLVIVLDNVISENPSDLPAIQTIGLALNRETNPPIPFADDIDLTRLPIRPVFALKQSTIAEVVKLLAQASEILDAHEFDNPYSKVIGAFESPIIPQWVPRALTQSLFRSWLESYEKALINRDIDGIERILDKMLCSTCNDAEEGDAEYGVPEARFSPVEHERFEDSLPALRALLKSEAYSARDTSGIEADAEFLANLSLGKGFFLNLETAV